MSDLVDEVRASFEKSRDENDDNGSPVQVIREGDVELAPGFDAMREFYGNQLLAVTRRAYRHHAGTTLTREADELLAMTGAQMMPGYLKILLRTFSDGVMVGHQSSPQVKISFHFHLVNHLFGDSSFREASDTMAIGFGENEEVLEYFMDYLTGGLAHLSHVTGFAHQTNVDPGKVWDIWLLIGTATVAASYLAGFKMGTAWRERDVLDGIEIATEENPSGSEGEDGSGQ